MLFKKAVLYQLVTKFNTNDTKVPTDELVSKTQCDPEKQILKIWLKISKKKPNTNNLVSKTAFNTKATDRDVPRAPTLGGVGQGYVWSKLGPGEFCFFLFKMLNLKADSAELFTELTISKS